MGTERRLCSWGLAHLISNTDEALKEMDRRDKREEELKQLLENVPEQGRNSFAFKFRDKHNLPVTSVLCPGSFVQYQDVYANGTNLHPDHFKRMSSAEIKRQRDELREAFRKRNKDYDEFFAGQDWVKH